MNLVIREQGLIVPKGNPKKIKNLRDLTRKDLTFINRQPGAGTRVLLDYKLGKLRIKPERIQGYEREETTHMAVAVAIASGLMDTGLGVKSAAKALGLDFVPIEREEYDLVYQKAFFNSDTGIQGYEREETTHMAVAVAIASGLMDTGLGVKSAAKAWPPPALGLDFVPIEREEYDLVFQKAFFNSDTGQRLVAVIRSDSFKHAAAPPARTPGRLRHHPDRPDKIRRDWGLGFFFLILLILQSRAS